MYNIIFYMNKHFYNSTSLLMLSSSEDIPISNKFCFCAEVGLSGEIRPVSRIEIRISEAEKLGFEKIFISKYNAKGQGTRDNSPIRQRTDSPGREDELAMARGQRTNIQIIPAGKMEEVFGVLFG